MYSGCAQPYRISLPGIYAEDPCLPWLFKARLAWETETDSDWPHPGPAPETCAHFQDIETALVVRKALSEKENGLLEAESAIGQVSLEALREVIRNWVNLPPEPGPNLDDIVAHALGMLTRKRWQDDDVVMALRIVSRLKDQRKKTARALAHKVLVEYPHRPYTGKWMRNNPKTAKRYLNLLKNRQLETHLEGFAKSYNTRMIRFVLLFRKWQRGSSTKRFWQGRLAFLERRYPDALHAFNFKISGAAEKRRQVWYARTLARLDRLSESERKFAAIGGKWDRWRCEARFRQALIASYASNHSKQQSLLRNALPHCSKKGDIAGEMVWEYWRALLADRKQKDALDVLNQYHHLLESGKFLKQTETAFWQCFLKQGTEKKCADLQDPFLAYRLAISNAALPTVQFTDTIGESGIATPLIRLLRDLRITGWDSLYTPILNELYRDRPDVLIEELAIHQALTTSVHASVKRIRTGLPAGRDLSWRHTIGLYPLAFLDLVERVAEEEKIPAELIWAIMREESRYNITAKSWVGAKGLMQLMPDTAKRMDFDDLLAVDSLFHSETNIRLGARLLANLVKYYNGNLIWAIAAYNAGRNAVDTWKLRFDKLPLVAAIEEIPYPQTRNYVKKVAKSYLVYRFRRGLPVHSDIDNAAAGIRSGAGSTRLVADGRHGALPLSLSAR